MQNICIWYQSVIIYAEHVNKHKNTEVLWNRSFVKVVYAPSLFSVKRGHNYFDAVAKLDLAQVFTSRKRRFLLPTANVMCKSISRLGT